MLATHSRFPFPGSSALMEGRLWRILRHNADGTATVYCSQPQASGHRTVALDDLTDPASAIARREDAALAVPLALGLRGKNAVRLTDAIDQAVILVGQLRLSGLRPTPARVRSILEDMGWQRTPSGHGPILYCRAPETLGAAA